LENHPQCQISSNSEAELPTRILDIDPPGPQASGTRLYETNGETGLYVALSHCWGKSQMLKTERGSLNLRRRNIPWDIIPRTFQDAITFVRRLGLRYLWIDSLCIYSYRTAMKHLRNLRFMPQFSEGFNFLSRSGKTYAPCF
jgi:hypothetical protein